MAKSLDVNLNFATNISDMLNAGYSADQLAATFTDALNKAQREYEADQKKKKKEAYRTEMLNDIIDVVVEYVREFHPEVEITEDFYDTAKMGDMLDGVIETYNTLNKITFPLRKSAHDQKKEEKVSAKDADKVIRDFLNELGL